MQPQPQTDNGAWALLLIATCCLLGAVVLKVAGLLLLAIPLALLGAALLCWAFSYE